MLTTTVLGGTNIVEIEFSGHLEADAMAECHRTLQQTIDEHGSIRLLARYGEIDLRKIEPAAFWEDLKNTVLIPKIDRCAIVAEQGSLRRVSEVVGRVLPAEIRTFEPADDAQARLWVAS
ncbi:STAS/SEC14 domain-containing protein [Mobilicoccus caccae]|uniref:STAS/SEC14 domain-containing protein n=1 Tax=Mobilicoccus caccae TaxID=1859295 RepID=A0ABQ6IRA0_9MICO|nr:STAS/SEC14 domain-containing protein [Mobilicoccus caccae]GMA40241.1 hypothetical protein GCM10025883_22860 [Mobilicoccus caccae]